jgi:glycosyltransferase involved in cell wall biosynthesis
VYGDGGELDQLVHRATELKIEDRIVFAGVRDADEIYASLDIAALTSRNEGTPLAIIEAMAAGKPVVSTAVGGVVDLLGAVEQRVETDGSFFEIRERGLTAPSDDAPAFASALEHLLHDETLRRRLVERGKAYVHRMHTKQRLVDDIVAIYRGLAGGETTESSP